MIRISAPSFKSLFLEMYVNDIKLSSGTGFIVKNHSGAPILITNRHNLTGRDQNTDQPLCSKTGAVPNKITIRHRIDGAQIVWNAFEEPLYDGNENKLWLEHPILGIKADFVALKLTKLDGVSIFDYELNYDSEEFILRPTDVVNVVGFPFGQTAGGSFAIWSTGHIASEPDINYNNLPVFLIDCRTKRGQSGSPVIHCGDHLKSTDKSVKLLGIYSGRINPDSDIGMVWKASAIKELVDTLD